jgi:riboflavin kinase / FMN adenylyltransferase
MRIIRDPVHCPKNAQGAVIALGNFDGVHTGHRSIISYACKTAHHMGVPAAVMTFEPHPREFFAKDGKRLRMYSLHQKLALLAELGVDTIYLMRFNQKLAATSAHDFVETILHQQLKARHLVTGRDFAYGKGREGNTLMLAGYAQDAGCSFTACDPVTIDGEIVSSSAIRTALREGKIDRANLLLGAPYRICGRVHAGAARGRTIGFPTANILLRHLFKPCFGVYAVRVRLPGQTQYLDAIANVGIKPTFHTTEPLLEVHIFDFDQMLYGQKIEVEFCHFLRTEQRFDSVDALVAQIHQDITRTKQLLSNDQKAPRVS